MRKNIKITSLLKNVTGSEVTLTHKAERPSNNFFQLFLCPNCVRNTPD